MKKINIDDMELDAYEREILQAFEQGKLKPAKNEKALIARARVAAHNTAKKMKKDCRITIRLSSYDLDIIRARAAEDGLPYQTLIASVIHQFATGRLRA